jgi:hypothetical protein
MDIEYAPDQMSLQLSKNELEYKKIIAEKDAVIEEQSTKISCMSTEFESMLNVRQDQLNS